MDLHTHNRVTQLIDGMSTPRPRTPAQREQSRRNGARSRGPVTAEGKRRSSRNSLKHGLLARRLRPSGDTSAPSRRRGVCLSPRERFSGSFRQDTS